MHNLTKETSIFPFLVKNIMSNLFQRLVSLCDGFTRFEPVEWSRLIWALTEFIDHRSIDDRSPIPDPRKSPFTTFNLVFE